MNNEHSQRDEIVPTFTPTLILIAAELYGPMNGAALVMDDGRELPITEEMVDECLQAFVRMEITDYF